LLQLATSQLLHAWESALFTSAHKSDLCSRVQGMFDTPTLSRALDLPYRNFACGLTVQCLPEGHGIYVYYCTKQNGWHGVQYNKIFLNQKLKQFSEDNLALDKILRYRLCRCYILRYQHAQ
jgi:hypothetical protein